MAQTLIYATSNANQSGVIITDQTDWTTLGVSRSTLSGISISIYAESLVTPEYTYNFTVQNEADYIANGTIELLFSDIVGVVNLQDGWWTIKMSSNSGGYVSNFAGFGIYGDITYAVWSDINGLHSPEEAKYIAERYCLEAIYLKGLGYLDTTNVNSRAIKFQKRLIALQKMLLKI